MNRARPMARRAAVFVALALSLAACVESSSKSKEAPARLASYVLDAPPEPPHKLEYVFDGKIRLLGYRVDPEGPIAPGKPVKVTMYWQTMERLEEGWLLFSHLLDEHGNRYASGHIDNVGPLRDTSSGVQALPPGDWQKGKVYVDEQAFVLPTEATREVVLAVGIWKGDQRKPITNGPGDTESRAQVVRIKTGLAGPEAQTAKRGDGREIRELSAVHLAPGTAPPKIDGKLDEDLWKTATSTGPLVDVTTGRPNTTFAVNGHARIAWDDERLYLGFQILDEKLVGGFGPQDRGKDPHLWEKECVEIMIDPDGDGDNVDYYEIQIGTQNLVFDSQFDAYNAPRGGPDGPFGHQEWSIGGATAVVVDGTLDDDGDTDKGYTVEAAIPWKSFAKAKKAPPAPGDAWRMNFYAMKRNSGVAWSPILGEGNFHRASRFGRVRFVAAPGAAASASASAPAPPSAAPSAPRPSPKKLASELEGPGSRRNRRSCMRGIRREASASSISVKRPSSGSYACTSACWMSKKKPCTPRRPDATASATTG